MTQPYRIDNKGRIDRTKKIDFCFDNVWMQGYEGDTLASALLANGVTLVGRSFKYHRPRGVFSAGVEETNALCQLYQEGYSTPNIPATMIPLHQNLIAKSQNRWPSLRYDFQAFNSYISRILPAGFYYKTFMWPPKRFWLFYEYFIRRMAGLGKAPEGSDPSRYESTYAHSDIVIIGAGAAGLSAALAAAHSGAKIILIDEQSEAGGRLLHENATINGKENHLFIEQTLEELDAMDNVIRLQRTTLSSYFDHNFLVAIEKINDVVPEEQGTAPRERMWQIRTKQVILAAGALERPAVFANNDLPGVMLADSIQCYLNRYGVLPGKNIVLFTNNDSAWKTALSLANNGAALSIVDCRATPSKELLKAAEKAGIALYKESTIVKALGKHALEGAVFLKEATGESFTLRCDLLGMSGGWSPCVHLYSQARGKLRFDPEIAAYVPDICQQNVVAVGACNGTMALKDILEEATEAGRKAVEKIGFKAKETQTPKADTEPSEQGDYRPFFPADALKRNGKCFIDFQNDSTLSDIRLALNEGYRSVEHFKRYTTTGMATDQGKTSNINAIQAMAHLLDKTPPEIGHTTYRPPYSPISFGAVAGSKRRGLFHVRRTTPMHPWHQENGAVFENVGDWLRPWYFPHANETLNQAVQRESLAARQTAGLMDGSSLGKILIEGPDATWLLEMLYTNAWQKLPIGHCRYGVMLNEHGMIFDDGVTTRTGEHSFHMTTTTGGAAHVMEWIEEWLQTEWPERKVWATSITEQWAVATLSGPYARAILQPLVDIDLDPEILPFMRYKAAHLAGCPVRIFRISFNGELAYEINVPARFGLDVWKRLIKAGKPYDLCPYGTETMHLLRAEKGFIIVGQDTDGTATPYDVNLGWIVSKKKQDFLGKRSLTRTDTARENRKQLVGLLCDNHDVVLGEGAHLLSSPHYRIPVSPCGHITSSYYSPNLKRGIALAMLENGFKKMGKTIYVLDKGKKPIKAIVSPSVFYDKEGKNINGTA